MLMCFPSVITTLFSGSLLRVCKNRGLLGGVELMVQGRFWSFF